VVAAVLLGDLVSFPCQPPPPPQRQPTADPPIGTAARGHTTANPKSDNVCHSYSPADDPMPTIQPQHTALTGGPDQPVRSRTPAPTARWRTTLRPSPFWPSGGFQEARYRPNRSVRRRIHPRQTQRPDSNARCLESASLHRRPPAVNRAHQRKACGVGHIPANIACGGSTISPYRNAKEQVDIPIPRQPNLHWLAVIGAHRSALIRSSDRCFHTQQTSEETSARPNTSEETSARPNTQVHQRGIAPRGPSTPLPGRAPRDERGQGSRGG
jgi:hypothetical protein